MATLDECMAYPRVDPRNTALFLDIDGTLLDFADTPDAACVPARLTRTLELLHGAMSGALAFVSGRSLASIDALFAPSIFPAVGCHGAEIRMPGGNVWHADALPETVRRQLADLPVKLPGLIVEDKRYALALHYRRAPQIAAALMAAIREILHPGDGIQMQEGKRVFDVKWAGVDKGTGLRTLMRHEPFRQRSVLFGGDDITDHDVFRILPALGGTGFSVGHKIAGAQYEFADPRAVREWLAQLAARESK